MAELRKGSAAVSAAGAEASRLRFGEVTIRNRGRLPHWEVDSGLYFITFRLADSLPKHVLAEIESKANSTTKPMPNAEWKRA